MNPLLLLKLVPGWAWGVLAAAFFVIAVGTYERAAGYRDGMARVQKAWDGERAERSAAEEQAIAQRAAENTAQAHQQLIQFEANERAHADEIAKVRAAAAAPGSLYVPRAVCDQFAGAAQAGGAERRDAAPAAPIALPERIASDLRALMAEADTVVANCRVAQRFLHENGFDKE